jgi:hypothetical protein
MRILVLPVRGRSIFDHAYSIACHRPRLSAGTNLAIVILIP